MATTSVSLMKEKTIGSFLRKFFAGEFERPVILGLSVFAFCVFFVCWGFPSVPNGGEESYADVMAYALQHHLQFGKDIVMTFGPTMPFLGGTYYSTNQFLWMVVLQSFLFGLCGFYSCLTMLSSKKWSYIISLFIFYYGIGIAWHTAYCLLPFLFFIVETSEESKKFKLISRGLLILGCAITVLFKGTNALLVFGSFFLADLYTVFFLRKFPIYTLCVTGTCMGILSLLGQNPISIFDILKGYYLLSSYFSEAMQSHGELEGIIWYLILFFSLLATVFALFYKESRHKAILLAIPFSVMGFVFFKASFVRHDMHMGQGLSFLIVSSVLVFSLAQQKLLKIRNLDSFRRDLFQLALTLLVVLAGYSARLESERNGYANSFFESIGGRIRRFSVLPVALESGYLSQLSNSYWETIDLIKKKYPLPSLDGSVDILPSRQSALVAHEVEYTPRPVFLHYASYGPGLIDVNRKFFESQKAPQYLLYDTHQQFLQAAFVDEAGNWPTIWSRYAFQNYVEPYYVLKRRPNALPISYTDISTEKVRFDQEVSLPKTDDLLWVSIEVKRTLIGRLVHFFFKVPPPQIVAGLDDNQVVGTPMITTVASVGFVGSMLIKSPKDFANVSQGKWKNNVKTITVKIGPYTNPSFYQPTFQVRIQKLEIGGLRPAPLAFFF